MADDGVVVVGAGLGGLTAALALRRAGRSVVVLERRGPGQVEGTALTLWAFAVAHLQQLGLRALVERAGRLERVVSTTSTGEHLSRIRVPSTPAPSVDMDRGALEAALAAAVGLRHIRFGAPCVAVEQDARRAVVHCADGSSHPGALVIGADGIGSCVRDHLSARGHGVRPSAFSVWRGFSPAGLHAPPRGVHLRMYGPGSLFGTARVDDERLRWYALTGDPTAPDAGDESLRRGFCQWADPVTPVLADAESITFTRAGRIAPLFRWHRGRIGLIGDAAHGALPTLGISGGLAIADGVALAAAVTAHGAGPRALRAYEQRRRPAGWRIQLQAEAMGALLAIRSRPWTEVRQLLMSHPYTAAQQAVILRFVRGG